MILILTFNANEKRIFNAFLLLEFSAFKPLEQDEVFKSAKVDHGVVVWLDGDIDIAPEVLYRDSLAYLEAIV